MWFKNLQLYRLTETPELTAGELNEKLLEKSTRPCQGLDTHTLGWDKPLGRDGELLLHEGNGCTMICMRKEERVLPSSVVREVLDEKVAEIEAGEARTVGRKEKMKIRDEIMVDLLPRAFTRSTRLYAYLDTAKNWFIVDTTSAKKAEELMTLLRDTLGSLKVKPFEVKDSPAMILTSWLTGQAPADFELQDECELRDTTDDGGIVRLRRHELDGNEISVHLDAGKQAVKLAVAWNERLSCVLSDDVSVKRLRFLDVVQDEAADANAESYAEMFDVDFALMTLELRQFIERLLEIYGGMPADE